MLPVSLQPSKFMIKCEYVDNSIAWGNSATGPSVHVCEFLLGDQKQML